MEPTVEARDLALWLFLSFLLTWGVGLTPPLITRFAVLRRPMSKGAAFAFAAAFWMINIGIFTALGSRSKSHFALTLVALASYYIVRIGAPTTTSKRQ